MRGTAESTGFTALDPCVHCGFCLPACPTYLATGDEADSPRGRIVLMRALESGAIPANDEGLRQHLDACLGCRGCEPVCPSGVGYGRGLEAARELMVERHGLGPLAGIVLAIFRHQALWRSVFSGARLLRGTGIADALAGSGTIGFAMGMVAATKDELGGWAGRRLVDSSAARPPARDEARATVQPSNRPTGHPPNRPTVSLFRGCVMDVLFAHVHQATRRTLEANGYTVVEVKSQVCCGALHEHAGDRHTAMELARLNLAAFGDIDGPIAVNSAGCGALLKEYGHLLGTAEATAFAARVRDVSELLAERGPRQGAPLALEVAYDAPCHLQHAQRIQAAPLTMMGAIPELRLRLLPGSDQCCGSAGIYSILQPRMSRAVLNAKIAGFGAATPRPAIVATGNPGCLMQIGAGLRAARLPIEVRHPVELLDWSYRGAGFYEDLPASRHR